MTRLVLVRHGQTAYNTQRRFQGTLDIPLDRTGESQARKLAEYLAEAEFEHILASDLSRARATAEAIAGPQSVGVMVDERLRECCFGEWQGILLSDVQERWPEEYTAWLENSEPAPGGEHYGEVRDRMGSAITDVIQSEPSGPVLLVSHSAAIKMTLSWCMGIDIPTCRRFVLGEGSISELQYFGDDMWRVIYLNRAPREGERA